MGFFFLLDVRYREPAKGRQREKNVRRDKNRKEKQSFETQETDRANRKEPRYGLRRVFVEQQTRAATAQRNGT